MAALGSQTVKGDVLEIVIKVDGDRYTVRDTAGHEVLLYADKITKLDGTFRVGDTIEAQVTDKGHILSMTHVKRRSKGRNAL